MFDAFTLNCQPLCQPIAWLSPATAFTAFADDDQVVWLDSGPGFAGVGRYSYIAASPFSSLIVRDGRIISDGKIIAGDPLTILQVSLARWRLPEADLPVPFIGGAAGFFGYGLAGSLEVISPPVTSHHGIPDMAIGFYDVIIAFDHERRQAWIISSGLPAAGSDRLVRATARADLMRGRLKRARAPVPVEFSLSWKPEMPRRDYERQIARILDFIRAGDIFQANFTSRFIATRPPGVRPADIYGAIRARNPAPFGAFIQYERFTLASVSPERFIALDQAGRIEARPIKGTAPRHENPAQDDDLASGLLASTKNQAENLMIVDLMRNDLGRVAEIGSIRVPALARLESYAHVHHLVSVVTGRLRAGQNAIDLLRGSFPPGSVTGAPKLRAMEIIGETEIAPRGAYCGIAGWIGFDGAMDSSVIIRTLSITEDQIIAQAGGAIVADSDPSEEYDEMLLKIRPLLMAVGEIERFGR